MVGKFEKICMDIKSLKIQGATNVAIAALKAFSIKPTQDSVKKLIFLILQEMLGCQIRLFAFIMNRPVRETVIFPLMREK